MMKSKFLSNYLTKYIGIILCIRIKVKLVIIKHITGIMVKGGQIIEYCVGGKEH